MNAVLAAGVQPSVINAAGWIVGGGGLLLTAIWLHYLYH